MKATLYHPELGYYTNGKQRVGRKGDFFTSVSTGKFFGMTIAHRIKSYWKEINSPSSFHIIEMGANSAQLALDILETLQQIAPKLYQNLNYHIIEHLPSMIKTQRKTLTNHTQKLLQHTSPNALKGAELTGIILSNELIDAYPVKIIKKNNNSWLEAHVTSHNNEFTFIHESITDPHLLKFTKSLPKNLPENYTTEFRPNLEILTQQWASLLKQGLIITIDYGYTYSSYYAPHRTTGTLRTFHNHQAGENPLENIGSQDLTAHVDFTQLSKQLINTGFTITHFSQQAAYLTKYATPWLTTVNSPPTAQEAKFIRQFQTLTHPTMLGKQFFVLEAQTSKKTADKNLLKTLEINL